MGVYTAGSISGPRNVHLHEHEQGRGTVRGCVDLSPQFCTVDKSQIYRNKFQQRTIANANFNINFSPLFFLTFFLLYSFYNTRVPG